MPSTFFRSSIVIFSPLLEVAPILETIIYKLPTLSKSFVSSQAIISTLITWVFHDIPTSSRAMSIGAMICTINGCFFPTSSSRALTLTSSCSRCLLMWSLPIHSCIGVQFFVRQRWNCVKYCYYQCLS